MPSIIVLFKSIFSVIVVVLLLLKVHEVDEEERA